MCLFPKKIPNPSLSWHLGMPKYIVVTCNQCSECRAQRQQEWYVRASEEFRRNKSNFFATLTFRNADLPFYEDVRDFQFISEETKHYENYPVKVRSLEQTADGSFRYKNLVNFRFPCFDGEMITSFKKLFREYLHREFPDANIDGMKWFICGEYGKHTKRPHYHLTLHCPFFLPVSVFRKIICKSWTHGFVGASRNKGFLIKSEGALSYTSKYVNKDLYYFNQAMSKYLDKEHLDPAEYNYRYDKVKRFLPKVRVSQGFGKCIADRIKAMPNAFDYCCLPRPIQRFAKGEKIVHYPLPRYIMSILTREIDKDSSKLLGKPVYCYTDFGMKLRRKLFEHRSKIDSVEVSKFQDKRFIELTLSQVDSYESRLRKYIAETLPPLFQYISCENLTFYRKLLRYLPVDMYGKHSAFWYMRRKDEILHDFFEKQAMNRDLWLEKIDNDIYGFKSDFYIIGMPLKEYGDLSQIPTLSETGEFRLYEQACSLIDSYYRMHSRQRGIVVDARNERIDKVRSMCNEFTNYDSDGVAII